MNMSRVKVLLAMTATVCLASSPSHAVQAEGREVPLMARFDKDGDKKLNATERRAALDYVGRGRNNFRPQPAGPAITPASVPFPQRRPCTTSERCGRSSFNSRKTSGNGS